MLKSIRLLFLITLISAPMMLSACAASRPSTPKAAPIIPTGDHIALGQRAYVDGPIVEPVKILEDSRCPSNVSCIWAGRLRVAMLWHRPNGHSMPFIAELGTPVHIADGSFQLIWASPATSENGATIAPADYRFHFRFDGGH